MEEVLGEVLGADDALVEGHLLRALRYALVVTAAGGALEVAFLDEYARRPRSPRNPLTSGFLAQLDSILEGPLFQGATESPAAFLERMGWIEPWDEDSDPVVVTGLGRALVRALTSAPSIRELAVDASQPLSYASLIDRLGTMGPFMLVDPFLSADQVGHLLEHTACNRILTREQMLNLQLVTLLESAGELDARFAPKTRLHDRHVICDSGEIWMLGHSLSGPANDARAFTVLVPLSPLGGTPVREHYERLYEESKLLEQARKARSKELRKELDSLSEAQSEALKALMADEKDAQHGSR